MTPSQEWVIVRVLTDPTGHPSVSVVGTIFRGACAGSEAYKESQRLNSTSRSDMMEVFLPRQIGVDSG